MSHLNLNRSICLNFKNKTYFNRLRHYCPSSCQTNQTYKKPASARAIWRISSNQMGCISRKIPAPVSHPPIFLLSIDGGGILGLIALQVLEYLEERLNQPISSLFDCITGVSAGGLMALGLAIPHAHQNGPAFSAQQLHNFFKKSAKRVFQKTRTQQIVQKIPFMSTLDALLFSKYCQRGAQDVYGQLFGHRAMSESLTHTIIPAYNIHSSGTKRPHLKIFDSLAIVEKKRSSPEEDDFLMSEIALATSAVPTYFPPQRMHKLGTQSQKILTNDYLIDGAVAINNPTILAYSELRLRYPNSPIHVLSLGLGSAPNIYHKVLNKPSPGALAWLGSLEHLIVSPQLSVYEMLFENLKKEGPISGAYWRIQPHICTSLWKFDDISEDHLSHITQIGAQMMEDHRPILDAVVTYLSQKDGTQKIMYGKNSVIVRKESQ